MKILFLCKRKYMNHDVIDDRYGRLYYLPYELSKLGHQIICSCLSYKTTQEIPFTNQTQSHQVPNFSLHSYNAGHFGQHIPRYIQQLLASIKNNKPDIIIGGSDAFHVIITHLVSKLSSIPFFIDLYDNFESFGLSKLPLMKWGYTNGLRASGGITTVSKALERHINEHHPNVPTLTLESTIASNTFKPCDTSVAREKFNLPPNAILIGTAGSLSSNRGTDTLFKAFTSLTLINPNIYLVLAGPLHGTIIPTTPRIIYLGELPHDVVNYFVNALDVAIICMKDDAFGRYAFPQKAYEILSSQTPVVSADTGALHDLFLEYPACLYAPDDERDLAEKLLNQINEKIIPDIIPPEWNDQAKHLETFITSNL
ncbi:glycosyltransferase family 4 protein [Desulfosediminicola flagellatus]|uniref:glycosyltransferase family 4 protein n=1 Tax=Desulfosediminicola flagellatus TaxID=2569541 RepID=UPI0010AD319A|nr:glycosyltransferase family 4 protein [Desulfosediminicola flagellatus]